jgi:hypothetical protein
MGGGRAWRPWRGGTRPAWAKEEEETGVGHVGRKAEQAGGGWADWAGI